MTTRMIRLTALLIALLTPMAPARAGWRGGIGVLIALRPVWPMGSAVGSGLAAGMFLTTLSFLVTTPGWEPSLGGFPALSAMPGQSLLKDVVLLGVALWSAGEALEAVRRRGALVAATTQGAAHNDQG